MANNQKSTSIDTLNTRDILLLAQLVEQHGGIQLNDEEFASKLDLIHEEYVNHPVFLLSHNELNEGRLDISKQALSGIIRDLLERHPGESIVEICELYYQQRIQELEAGIRTLEDQFAKVRPEVK